MLFYERFYCKKHVKYDTKGKIKAEGKDTKDIHNCGGSLTCGECN